jgi:Cu-processing system ATP-binding protein
MMVLGEAVDGDASYRHRIGYMPQAARFPEHLTGREVLEMLRDVRGRPLGSDDFLLRHLELEGELDKPVRILSGGTQQKLSAVIAFLFHPALLILDEPTAGLDPIASVLFKDKIRHARDEGASVVLTSHVLSEVEELADAVVFLLDGKVRFEGSVEQLRAMTGRANLERAIGSLMTRLTP